MKHIRIISSVAILLVTLSGCGNQKVQNNYSQKDTSTTESTTDNQENTTKSAKDSTITNSNKLEKGTNSTTSSQNTTNENSLKEKVIDYIINGQGDKPEAEKIKWSEAFLNKVDIDVLYNQYIVNGGITDDLEDFSKYITLNAPIPTDWEKLFENDFSNRFGEKVVKLDHIEGDLYQAYINHDGIEIPYVVVSSRTGYFHG